MEKKFVDIGKETLAYIDEGSGDNIVFIHGNMSSSLHYSPLIERLKSKYRCVALDLRGFGDSTYNERFDSLKELAEDVKKFLDAIGITSANVVGWSTGGGIAMELAAMSPDLVKAMFIVEGVGLKGYPIFQKNASFSPVKGKIYACKEDMAKDPVQVAPVLSLMSTKNTFGMGAMWDAVIYTVNKPDEKDNELWLSETVKQRNLEDLDWALANFNMSDENTDYQPGNNRISLIKCMTAFTLGEKDLVVPDYMVLDNFNALKHLAKLYPYENCGHSPLVDCPDRLAADMDAFFSI